jgi:cell filamentation protein
VTVGDPYLYSGTSILRNRLGLTNPDQLDQIERRLVAQRIAEGVPFGGFDLAHLRAIHRHLFQDVYEWAGELRTVEIAKAGNQFQFRQFIEVGMADVHRRLEKANFLQGLSGDAFAKAAGVIMGDVNYVHPFREGNGRTQLQYLEQLAAQARHKVHLARIDPERWLHASRASHQGNYGPMAAEIGRCLTDSDPEMGPSSRV